MGPEAPPQRMVSLSLGLAIYPLNKERLVLHLEMHRGCALKVTEVNSKVHLNDFGIKNGGSRMGPSAGDLFPSFSFGGGLAQQRWLWESNLVRQNLCQVL